MNKMTFLSPMTTECKSCHVFIPKEEMPMAQENGGYCHYCGHRNEKEGLMLHKGKR